MIVNPDKLQAVIVNGNNKMGDSNDLFICGEIVNFLKKCKTSSGLFSQQLEFWRLISTLCEKIKQLIKRDRQNTKVQAV